MVWAVTGPRKWRFTKVGQRLKSNHRLFSDSQLFFWLLPFCLTPLDHLGLGLPILRPISISKNIRGIRSRVSLFYCNVRMHTLWNGNGGEAEFGRCGNYPSFFNYSAVISCAAWVELNVKWGEIRFRSEETHISWLLIADITA